MYFYFAIITASMLIKANAEPVLTPPVELSYGYGSNVTTDEERGGKAAVATALINLGEPRVKYTRSPDNRGKRGHFTPLRRSDGDGRHSSPVEWAASPKKFGHGGLEPPSISGGRQIMSGRMEERREGASPVLSTRRDLRKESDEPTRRSGRISRRGIVSSVRGSGKALRKETEPRAKYTRSPDNRGKHGHVTPPRRSDGDRRHSSPVERAASPKKFGGGGPEPPKTSGGRQIMSGRKEERREGASPVLSTMRNLRKESDEPTHRSGRISRRGIVSPVQGSGRALRKETAWRQKSNADCWKNCGEKGARMHIAAEKDGVVVQLGPQTLLQTIPHVSKRQVN